MCKFESKQRGRCGTLCQFESKERGRRGIMWQFESKERASLKARKCVNPGVFTILGKKCQCSEVEMRVIKRIQRVVA